MSHVTKAKIKIKNPRMEILELALRILAKKIGGKVVRNTTIYGYRMREEVPLAVLVRLPYGNGYGIKVENGEVVVVVDEHGAPLSAEQFAKELQKNYVVVATRLVAEKLGWDIASIRQYRDLISIELVR